MPPEPSFIFSFDCEGKWGMADHLGEGQRGITDAALRETYARLLEMLGGFRVPATFAFVGGMIGEREQTLRFLETVRPVHPRYAAWIAAVKTAIAASPGGWFLPDLPGRVVESGGHEFASHGGTHAPLDEDSCAPADFRAEMEFLRAAEAGAGLHAETFIFPRNLEGYSARLADFGFAAFRRTHPIEAGRSRPARLLRLASEWLPRSAAPHAAPARPMALPAGLVLNFANGPRGLVPRRITALRARGTLLDGVARNRTAHFYSHPHNFITDPGLFETFRRLLGSAAELRERGLLAIKTQAAYARSQPTAQAAAPGGSGQSARP